jgi:hypothetical protein
MKRSQALIPLSREHHAVLGPARRAVAHSTGRGDPASLGSFGLLLEAHVWFEQRELFPLAQAILPASALAAIAARVADNPIPHVPTTTGA